ncbi:hypothetical protein [Enterococcus sp. DIV0756]|uniref:hypothetical protein n=1 Tax=Enterococcus sp. DIV0756 TaxID=2774636 RepID=UPI003F236FA1
MSYHSKRILGSIVLGCCLAVAYVVYVFRLNPQLSTDLSRWARVVLVFIGIGIIGAIISHIIGVILYTIKVSVTDSELSEKDVDRVVESSLFEDEMDKLIGLRASRVGYYLSGFGAIVGIAILAFGMVPFVAVHIMLAGFFLGNLVEGIMCIYLYEKGVQHG